MAVDDALFAFIFACLFIYTRSCVCLLFYFHSLHCERICIYELNCASCLLFSRMCFLCMSCVLEINHQIVIVCTFNRIFKMACI